MKLLELLKNTDITCENGQENIEIFEDSQRMYGSNPRLISAIKKSNEKQEP